MENAEFPKFHYEKKSITNFILRQDNHFFDYE